MSTERARSRVDRATGPRPARAPHPRQRAIQKARPDLGIGHAVMLPDSNRSSIWTGELKPAPLGSDARRGAPEAQRPARLLLAAIVAIARAAGFPMLVMSRIRHAAIGLGGCGPGSPDGCGCEQPCGLQAAWLAGPSRPKRAAKYPEYRCRTTIAVPIGENASETGSLSGIR